MGSLSMFTDQDDISDSHLWLSQCRDRRIPKDIQSKCMLYQKLTNMAVDNPNLVEPIKNKKERRLLLYDQPWNQNSVCKDNVIRVYNWKEVYETISEF